MRICLSFCSLDREAFVAEFRTSRCCRMYSTSRTSSAFTSCSLSWSCWKANSTSCFCFRKCFTTFAQFSWARSTICCTSSPNLTTSSGALGRSWSCDCAWKSRSLESFSRFSN
ncbi:Hypothetical_protein [Hexamita inflata]|uniref:Hypothetical_protein n=1 Tax=Hexamita inflata TaxID=28002 RepID=A0AA86PE88_9EUKA|nr:Hypothetical protein HINF_LOCUS25265 [Hexamita inflata]CAI9944499.1 Hypothetical protein HINF_LOCUS32144 [Hexamita inflata]